MKLEGLYTAMVTPFLHELLDENGLIELIHTQLAARVDGLVFLGTTGESPTLSERESKRVIEIAVQELQGAVPVIVGTGTHCTSTTIEKTKMAQDLGADVALLIMPYYNCPTQDGLLRHIEAVLNQTHLPLLLYNHPKRTGVNLEVSTLLKLSKHEKILGLKEANSQDAHLTALFEAQASLGERFSILCGCDEKLHEWMQRGMKGIVSVMSNAFPLVTKQITSDLLQKKYDEAKAYLEQWSSIIEFCSIETNPIPIKALLSKLGLPAGEPRLPLTPLTSVHQKMLENLLKVCPGDLVCKN